MRTKPLASVKSDRLLQQHRILEALQRGEEQVLIGPIYELRSQPGVRLRVAFHRDDEDRLCVGYASKTSGDWLIVESEPYSMRALAYYERRLKRIGDFVESAPRKR
ncbi:MAG: hypothetical protein HY270_10980 [Deltaproteobacteria bacterium]|nr:hypothetical protein [Deltaproteobacteria bacterium]